MPGTVLACHALPDRLTFLDKASFAAMLEVLPPNPGVEVDGWNTRQYDYDALETLLVLRATAKARGIVHRLVGVPEVETTPAR